MKSILEIGSLNVRYGSIHAVKDLSMRIEEGELVSLLGSNGAGKSTLLDAISRIVPVSSGSIVYDGRDALNLKAPALVPLGMSHCPEGRRIFPEMRVEENLLLGAYTKGKSEIKLGLERAFNYFPVLKERFRQSGGTLSGGEQQMLALARALMSSPKLLLLDEPSLGLAPKLIEQIFRIISQINRDEGVSMLLVEQNANEALLHSKRAYVMENGRISIEGPSSQLLRDPRVIDAYLG